MPEQEFTHDNYNATNAQLDYLNNLWEDHCAKYHLNKWDTPEDYWIELKHFADKSDNLIDLTDWGNEMQLNQANKMAKKIRAT